MSILKGPGNRTVKDFKDASFENIVKKDRTLRHNIEYGTIVEVDLETSRVKVERQNGRELTGPNGESKFFPLLTPITTIHMLYGSLRPGLKVRIHWVGENEPDGLVVVDVVSNDSLLFQKFGLTEMERGFNMGSLEG